jgi:crossover junction endodeoxyribonuclease RusA
MSIRIELPWPVSGLSPNARKSPYAKANLVAAAREIGYVETRLAMQRQQMEIDTEENLPLRITFAPPDARRRDLDNAYASMKAALDGMADALGMNDRLFHPVTLDWEHQRPRGRVVVELVP